MQLPQMRSGVAIRAGRTKTLEGRLTLAPLLSSRYGCDNGHIFQCTPRLDHEGLQPCMTVSATNRGNDEDRNEQEGRRRPRSANGTDDRDARRPASARSQQRRKAGPWCHERASQCSDNRLVRFETCSTKVRADSRPARARGLAYCV